MPRDHRLDFGIFVAIRREEMGMDGTRLAAACSTTQTTYSNWERCKALPEAESDVRTLAKALDIREERLVDIWHRTRKDVERKGGYALVTRAYGVKKKLGAKTTDPYPVSSRKR